MRDFLNRMPGPPLTMTDVAQRLKAVWEEEHDRYPNEQFQPGCLALFEREMADGTELPAIIELLRDHVDQEEKRIRIEQRESYQQYREQDRMSREQRLLSGADCN
jgi:hypothetical protein